jgi:hypothetical protein
VRAEINFHYIVVLQNCSVSKIRSPVSRTVVDAGTCRESNTRLNLVGFNQTSVGLFNFVTDVHDLPARSDVLLSMLSNLSVALSSFPEIVVVIKLRHF